MTVWFFIFIWSAEAPATFGPFKSAAECERIRTSVVAEYTRAYSSPCYRGRLPLVTKAKDAAA